MTWYEDWFDRDEYEIVYRERDEDEAEQVVDLIEASTDLTPDASILDVGCGRGRHARVLARRGYEVTGIDLSERSITEARTRAGAEGLDITFRVQDMRDPMGTAAYDAVVNLFTTFGYFKADADHVQALRHMARALRSDGWLVQDFLNAPHIIDTLEPEDVRVENGVTIEQRRTIDDGRINKTITLRKEGESRTFRESVRLFTLDDFKSMYQRIGVDLVDTYGSYDGDDYTSDSPRLIMIARNSTS